MVPVDTASRGRARASLVLASWSPRWASRRAPAVGTADVSFDPSTACAAATDEGHYRGAYPELEALLPGSYEQAAPTRSIPDGRARPRRSGRSPTRHPEVHFAGARWDLGNGRGLTVAVFGRHSSSRSG